MVYLAFSFFVGVNSWFGQRSAAGAGVLTASRALYSRPDFWWL